MFIGKSGAGAIFLAILTLLVLAVVGAWGAVVLVQGMDGDLTVPISDGRLVGFPVLLLVVLYGLLSLACVTGLVWFAVALARMRGGR